jgi:SecD/SecF fusion protein
VVFNIFEKKRWITKLNMMQWFKKTDFDFVRLMKPAAALSSILVLACLIGVVARGKDILDIDFTGGSSVQVQFKQDQPQDLAKVRRAVADLPDVAVSAVGTDNREFKIDTSEDDVDAVTEVLKKAFGDALSTYSMSFDNVRPYVADAASGAAGATDAPSQGAATVQPAAPETADKPVADEVIVEEDMKEETPEDTTPAAETPAEETSAEEPAIDKPAEDAPEAPATEEAPAAEDAPADAPPASDAPADAPPANEQSAVPTTLRGLSPTETVLATLVVGQKAAGDAPADAPAADAASTPVEGTSVDLTFPELVNYATLHDWIVAELKSADLAGTYFNLTGKDFTAGSSARYADWTLNIMLPAEQTTKMLDRIRAKLADEPVFPAANNIGGKVADNTKLSAVYAVLASLVIIVLYVWIRFQNVVFGFAAVLALLHDVMMALGFLALSYWLSNDLGLSVLLIDPFKISLAVVAALLTIVGFSINDTIVIFDRIREIRGKSPELTGAMINRAINETLSRTFITSGTLLIAVLILYIYGGSGIHPFAFTMLIGVISGTYSTVFIAAPILLYLFPHKSTGTSSPAASSKAPMASAGS